MLSWDNFVLAILYGELRRATRVKQDCRIAGITTCVNKRMYPCIYHPIQQCTHGMYS